jgi:hypothetical protein
MTLLAAVAAITFATFASSSNGSMRDDGSKVAAGSYVQPQPIDRENWTLGVRPPESWLNESTMPVGSSLTVGLDGAVQACATSRTSGTPQLDQFTCDLLKKRARFNPARAPDGTPIYGVFRVWSAWTNWLTVERDAYDFQVVSDELASRLKGPQRIDIAYLVDAAGNLASCWDENHDDVADFVAAACKLLPGRMISAVVDEAGVPVPSVQDATPIILSSKEATKLEETPSTLVCDAPAGHVVWQNLPMQSGSNLVRARVSFRVLHPGTKWPAGTGLMFALPGDGRYAGVHAVVSPERSDWIGIVADVPDQKGELFLGWMPVAGPLQLSAQFVGGILTVSADQTSWSLKLKDEPVEGAFFTCNSGKFSVQL